MIANTTSTETTKRNSHRESLLIIATLSRPAKIFGGRQAFAFRASRLSCSAFPQFVRRRDRLEAPQELQLLIAKHSRPGRAKSRADIGGTAQPQTCIDCATMMSHALGELLPVFHGCARHGRIIEIFPSSVARDLERRDRLHPVHGQMCTYVCYCS